MARTVKMGGNLVGHTVGQRYKVDQRIGAGGFAVVYRAKDTRINKYVAIKVLDRDKVRSLRDIGRFRNEAAIAAVVDDDHIVKVSDYGEEDGLFYVVMELLRGHTLRQLLLLNERMTWQRACQICAQVCVALEAAHGHGVIHRDVKPENIFLENRRGGEHVKLLDLGIAKVINDDQWEGLAQNLSLTGDFVGSPSYIAPEQARGPQRCDFRVDLYAVGIMLYEMIVGDVPFRGESAWETVLMHVERTPDPPSQRAKQKIPAAYDALTLRALAKDPNKRFRNAAEMAAALREVLAAGPPATPEEIAAVERSASSGSHGEVVEAAGDVLAATEAAEVDTNKLPQKPARPIAVEPPAEDAAVSVVAATQPQIQQPQIQPPPPAEPRPEPVVRAGSTVAFKPTLPETESVSPSATPREIERSYEAPIPPLRWRARFYVTYLLAGSLLATCTLSTALALTLDPSHLEHLAVRNHIKVIERPTDYEYDQPLPPKPKAAPAPAPEPESPYDRLLRAPADPPPEPAAATTTANNNTKKVVARPGPAKSRPSADDGLLEVSSKGPSMAMKARGAAAGIREACKITPFSPLAEAKVEVLFTIDVSTGAILTAGTVGEVPPLQKPDCVRTRAAAIIKTFSGARDLKAEYSHIYTVER
jgi:serine/threonine protein kinase